MDDTGGMRQRGPLAVPTTAPASAPVAPSRPPLSRQVTDGSSYTTPTWDDDVFSGMSGLLDMLSMVDAYLELWTRGLRKEASSWREKADRLVEESKTRAQKIKLPRVKSEKFLSTMANAPFLSATDRDLLSKQDRERLEEKYREFRHRADAGFKNLQTKWEEEKTVRLRDKVSFFIGVHNVLGTALILGFAPTWIPLWYTAQIVLYTPTRVYTYKKRLYHYFLFDLCYAVNLICLIYLWVFPGSAFLFTASYGLAMGSLGTAIATWRNSLVFHSLDKVTSLAIHIFPPLVFTTVRHFYPNADVRYPALAKLKHFKPWKAVAINMLVYLIWQCLYFFFVIVKRKDKIAQGRATSFTFLINDKRRLIGKIAAKVPPQFRESAFMAGQAVYTFVTLLLPIFVLYDSKFWSSVYLLVLFGFSTWSGGSFYLDVFARKFEKELIALRKEFAEQQALMSRSNSVTHSPSSTASPTLEPEPEPEVAPSDKSYSEMAESEDGSIEDAVVVDGRDARAEEGDLGGITGKEGLGAIEHPVG